MPQVTKQLLHQKYQEFLKDTTQLTRLKQQNPQLLIPGWIVELFVFDTTKDVKFLHDDFYVRYTGICKILHASPENSDTSNKLSPRIANLKEGDILSIGDTMTIMGLNPEWEDWFNAQDSPNNDPGEEPKKFLRRIHHWMSQGKLWYMDRAKYLANGKNLQWDDKAINDFRGPYVFRLDPMDVECVIDNPFESEL